jgi:ligand-binding SRPBCC domain-containing protein
MARPAVLERSIVIDVPSAAVHAFHLDPRNAARIAPPGTRVAAVEGDSPLRPGGLVTMRIRRRPLPVPLTWTVRIESVDPGRIVDVAERSPFALWRHEHLFRELGAGRTLLTDRVSYRLRGGRLGELLARAFVRRLLERDVAERQRRTREALEG